MQRFLGLALFFNVFLANFSELTANLNGMTKKTFDWNRTTWKTDYVYEYHVFPWLISVSPVYFPDYFLPWILRTDAYSDYTH